MANKEDVIELGSSDDEPDPAPKKHKLLPNPNAMVSIPSLSGLTVKPLNSPPTQKHKQQPVVIPRNVMIAKKSTAQANLNGRDIHRIPIARNQILPNKKNASIGVGNVVNVPKLPKCVQLTKTKTGSARLPATNLRDSKQMLTPKICNVSSVINNARKPTVNFSRSSIQLQKPHMISCQKINPMNVLAKKSVICIPSNVRVMASSHMLPQPPLPPLNEVMEKVKKHLGQQCLNSLPPEITVKRTKGQAKRPAPAININAKRPKLQANLVPKIGSNIGDVLTVELDDDEDTSNISNQWYIRPENANTSVKVDSAEDTKSSKEVYSSGDLLEVILEPCLDLNKHNNDNNESQKDKSDLIEANKEESIVVEFKKSEDKEVEPKEEDSDINVLSQENNEILADAVSTKSKQIEINDQMESDNIAKSMRVIEITIEDSPVKPILHRRASQISSDLAIEIEDSPIKDTETQKNDKLPHISEENEEMNTSETPKSKKKLNFTKPNKKPSESYTNIEQMPSSSKLANDPLVSINNSKLIEPIKTTSSEVIGVAENTVESVHSPKPNTSQMEFTDVYQSFIDLCLKIENSDDMRKIVEKKVKNYYRQVDKSFTESEEFVDLVSSKVCAMKVNPENLYLYIKDVVDELNTQRKMAKNKITDKPAAVVEGASTEQEEHKDSKNVRKLEKTLRKLHRAIQKLEEQEVDFDDDADSVYLLTESEDEMPAQDANTPPKRDRETLLKRYKERLVKVHAKLCQLTRTKMPSEAKVNLEVRPGRPKGPVQRLEKYINKKVPMGAPLPFPDFHDVLRCVKEANVEDNLGWSEIEVQDEARDLFVRCGKKLQKRRQQNEWRVAAARLQAAPGDPADADAELKRKLDANRHLADKKETDLINKYVCKQNDLKLVATEINDKEAEESPASEDDDCQEVEYVDAKVRTPEKNNSTLILDISYTPEKLSRSSEAVCETLSNNEWKYEINNEKMSKEVSVDSEKEPAKEHIESMISGQEVLEYSKIETISVETEDSKDSKSNKTSEKSDSESNKIVISGESSSQRIDTDIDELHLLKTSKNSNHSTLMNSSDSDEHVTRTDSSVSSPKEETAITSSEVVSIENSSDFNSEPDTGTSSREIQPFACTTDSESNEQIKIKIDSISLGSEEVFIPAQIDVSENEKKKEDKENIELETDERDSSAEDPCDYTNNTIKQTHKESAMAQNINDVVCQHETNTENDKCDDINFSSQNSPIREVQPMEIAEDDNDNTATQPNLETNGSASTNSHHAAIDDKMDEDTTMLTTRDSEMNNATEIKLNIETSSKIHSDCSSNSTDRTIID